MVRLIVVVAVMLEDVPVIVTVLVPVGAELLTVKVRTLVEEVLAGLNDALTPVGRPEAARLMPPESPLSRTVMVLDPLADCCRLTFAGEEESLRPGGGGWMFACAPPPPQLVVISERATTIVESVAPFLRMRRQADRPLPLCAVDNDVINFMHVLVVNRAAIRGKRRKSFKTLERGNPE